MGARRKVLALIAFLLLILCVPIYADSISTYNFTTSLSGGFGTANGTFTYNTTTNTILSSSLSFVSSIFGNVTLTSTTAQGGFLFLYSGTVKGDSILYSVLLNPVNFGQYWIDGGITNWRQAASFHYTSVPEGGGIWTAMCSLLTMLGAVAWRQRTSGRLP
ncbi:MAG TPA: hypothetical protein VFA68_12485 [Terriglobales bacterium]|nr:hypothetical protein [Terriglobales bacterium]